MLMLLLNLQWIIIIITDYDNHNDVKLDVIKNDHHHDHDDDNDVLVIIIIINNLITND